MAIIDFLRKNGIVKSSIIKKVIGLKGIEGLAIRPAMRLGMELENARKFSMELATRLKIKLENIKEFLIKLAIESIRTKKLSSS